jgi:sterol desaturase/sphingolipid hydroxylase (fatty acid hydroxylase superfamily)
MNWKLIIILSGLFLFGTFEQLFPFFTYKQKWTSRVTANFTVGILNSVLTNLLLASALGWVWHQKLWLGLFHPIQPTWVAGVLSVLILDFYRYRWHVLMHQLPLAWKFHRVHHSDRTLNISTAYRLHPFEVMLSYIPLVFLIWLFGMNPVYVGIYEIVFSLSLIFHHSNYALPAKLDRFLSYFMITPNLHRVHHSQIVEETDSNFGSLLSIWDRLCRTLCYHRNPHSIKLGLIEERRQLNIVDLLTLPFGG